MLSDVLENKHGGRKLFASISDKKGRHESLRQSIKWASL